MEIKTLSQDGDGTEEAVAACIKKYNMAERVIVSSFNPLVLKRFRPIAPEIPIRIPDYIMMIHLTQNLIKTLSPTEYEALHLHFMKWLMTSKWRLQISIN